MRKEDNTSRRIFNYVDHWLFAVLGAYILLFKTPAPWFAGAFCLMLSTAKTAAIRIFGNWSPSK